MASPDSILGRTLGHFRLIEQIGAGGMGIVYRARDERLEREVALKVLPTGVLADEKARDRFRREALALSRLNHPNIATVHDFDCQAGLDFLVTELIPGITLDEKLAAGPLPEKQVIRIGLQLADGLHAAHQQGVIHRDLKPRNLMLTPEGGLKILDFGLAKRVDPATTVSLTQSFLEGPVGTLAYMSPEQLKAENVDARSDIWGVGVVLYKLATSRLPFTGRTGTTLADEILHALPPHPQALQPRLSARVADIILKCLEKDSDNRYQSAKELAVDLRRLEATSSAAAPVPTPAASIWRTAAKPAGFVAALVVLAAVLITTNLGGWRWSAGHTSARRIQSLAVLPLANLSGDPEQEYFADGMTDALITDLAKIGSLRVISRTSAMHYKSTNETVPEIARELNVDALVEGTVQRSGERVRITAQLIHAPTDTHIWAESYERDMRGILELQSEVAEAIAREIKIKISPQEQAILGKSRPVQPAAHEAYLKGRYYFNKRGAANIQKAIEYFAAATQQDPDYAMPYAGLADCYNVLALFEALPPKDAYPKAEAAARKALEIDEGLAEAHTALAFTKSAYEWDWPGAEQQFRRAIELNPGYAPAHQWYAGLLLAVVGRVDEALAEAERARQLDPLSVVSNYNLGRTMYLAHQYDRAIEAYKNALELDPDFAMAQNRLGLAYVAKRRYPEAISELEELASRPDAPSWAKAALGYAYGVAGNKPRARQVLRELTQLRHRKYVPAVSLAIICTGLDDKDQAFRWLEESVEERSITLSAFKIDPIFESLRSDPRFGELLRRVGLEP